MVEGTGGRDTRNPGEGGGRCPMPELHPVAARRGRCEARLGSRGPVALRSRRTRPIGCARSQVSGSRPHRRGTGPAPRRSPARRYLSRGSGASRPGTKDPLRDRSRSGSRPGGGARRRTARRGCAARSRAPPEPAAGPESRGPPVPAGRPGAPPSGPDRRCPDHRRHPRRGRRGVPRIGLEGDHVDPLTRHRWPVTGFLLPVTG